MTLTDPRGDPSLLQTLVRNEHDRLEQLLDEASKETSTPGVHEEMVDQLRRFLASHVNTEAAVVHPVVRESLADDDADRLSRDTDDIYRLLREDSDVRRAGDVVHAHVTLVDDLLERLRGTAGGRRMATLGFDYSAVAEGASPRIPPT